MNSMSVVWIDREHARLFQFSDEKMERIVVRSRHQEHHTHAFDELDPAQWERVFYRDVVSGLDTAAKILILGPGVAKHHFMNFLLEHYPAVCKRVVACEVLDHPTDGQIAALARRYFG